MAPPTETSAQFEFPTEQEPVISSLSLYLRIASGLLFVVAALRVVTGVLDLLTNPLAGVTALIEGALTGFLGVVLLTGADDARYIVTTKGHDQVHLLNTIASVTVYAKVLFALGVIISLVLLLCLAL